MFVSTTAFFFLYCMCYGNVCCFNATNSTSHLTHHHQAAAAAFIADDFYLALILPLFLSFLSSSFELHVNLNFYLLSYYQ